MEQLELFDTFVIVIHIEDSLWTIEDVDIKYVTGVEYDERQLEFVLSLVYAEFNTFWAKLIEKEVTSEEFAVTVRMRDQSHNRIPDLVTGVKVDTKDLSNDEYKDKQLRWVILRARNLYDRFTSELREGGDSRV